MDSEHDWSVLEVQVRTSPSHCDRIDLGSDLNIDMTDINEAFCDQPAKFAYWATVYAQAQALVRQKEVEVSQYEEYMRKTLVGKLDSKVRQQIEMDGGKVTEGKVTSGIYAHPEYEEAQEHLSELREELINLRASADMLYAAREAMNQRKDMLISLGAQLRQEGSNSAVMVRGSRFTSDNVNIDSEIDQLKETVRTKRLITSGKRRPISSTK